MKKIIAFILCIATVFTGCAHTGAKTRNLMDNITAGDIVGVTYNDDIYTYLQDFSADMFIRSAKEGENTLVSPVSMLYLLAMLQNGACGETLEQLQNAVVVDTGSLNCFMAEFSDTAGKQVNTANGIWVNERFKANQNFLQTNADYFKAGIYSGTFDRGTVKEINNFVKKHTDGMIDKIVDRLEPSTVMCLVNALTFRDKWAVEYEKKDINSDYFANSDGTQTEAQFMYSEESVYLHSEDATGFIKPYKGGNYSFMALLPDPETDIDRFVSSLTADKLKNMADTKINCNVKAYIPEFEADFSASMIDTLKSMGIVNIFDPNLSNLSLMGESDYGLYVNTLIHKTRIEVNRQGTKAAAVSFASVNESCAAEPAVSYTVRLDRPFVYMIIHNETGLPLFMGTMAKMS